MLLYIFTQQNMFNNFSSFVILYWWNISRSHDLDIYKMIKMQNVHNLFRSFNIKMNPLQLLYLSLNSLSSTNTITVFLWRSQFMGMFFIWIPILFDLCYSTVGVIFLLVASAILCGLNSVCRYCRYKYIDILDIMCYSSWLCCQGPQEKEAGGGLGGGHLRDRQRGRPAAGRIQVTS